MDIGQIMNTSLKWMVLAGLVWLGLGRATAEEFVERPANSAQEGHRFLFVVETSAANRKFENSNRQALFDLVVGGVNGHMRSGDTYGIWTYSDEVRAGEFPLTIWEKEQALDLAGQAAAFLQKQKYAKRASPSFLVDDLRRLSDRVGDFNVFIICSGEDPISGTPFDQNINAAYKALGKQSARTGRPMVTSFAVRKSRPVRAGVVLAGDRLVLPERPPEPLKPPTRRIPAATNSANTVAAASSNSVPTATTAPTPPRQKVIQIVTKTNTAAATSPTSSVTTATAPPDPGITNALAAALAASAVSVPPEPTNVEAETPPAPSATVAPATLAPTPIASIAAPPPAPTPTPTAAPTPPAPTPAANQTVIKERPAEVEPVVAAATTGSTGLRMAAPAPGLSSASSSTTAAPGMVVMAREILGHSNSTAQSAEASVLQGTIVPVRTVDGLSAGVLLAIGGTLLGAASFLLILLLRRAPSVSRGSLITQAMRPER
jgi:hypothetical protein